jgi:isopentenyl diphosphate isomerase/L-lactate dehydrogenase-like FMN-dependent dehydrogenase
VRKALEILRDEVDITMALIGCPSVTELGPDFLFENQGRVDNQALAAE